MRRSFQEICVIWKTTCRCRMPWGYRSRSIASSNSRYSALFSYGRMGKCWLRRPWVRALRETMRLPSAVFGPVDFFALRRLARMRFREIGRLVTEATDFFEAAMRGLLLEKV